MLQIRDISMPLNSTTTELKERAAKILHIRAADISEFVITKQSIDARKKNDIHYVYTVNVLTDKEGTLLRHADKKVSQIETSDYRFPDVKRSSKLPPVVVGMGPAGLFAALQLARAGIPCLILERGQPVEQRASDINLFWSGKGLNTESNVQFGEGGAGTFSDGKLNTGTHDPRISHVLSTFVEFGAPEEITYLAKPHIGTDNLRKVIVTIRNELLSLGCEIRFGTKLVGINHSLGKLTSIEVEKENARDTIECDTLVLAPGHSARDTFKMLRDAGLNMEQKAFAIGVRIEHPQEIISRQQYGPMWESLPAATYKLACHLKNGRGVFSFCVCPGGQVVAATSENGHVVTNGMSNYARDERNINGGLLVSVNPSDFGSGDVLAGVNFQRHWEENAYKIGGNNYYAPAQYVGDFLNGVSSNSISDERYSYAPGISPTDMRKVLPDFVSEGLLEGIPLLDRKLKGFADSATVLTGIETRSSSPVRIIRNENFQSNISGIYPCGEGAGYAGGITSAAVDGIRIAEAVAEKAI